MKFLFIGGSGRSGTSFVADRLSNHQQISSLKNIELKIIYELGGLFDLREILTKSYSPNRAQIALYHLQEIQKKLASDIYAQSNQTISEESVHQCFVDFYEKLYINNHPVSLSCKKFNAAAKSLLENLASLSSKNGSDFFLEKTPHVLLNPIFLKEITRNLRCIHIVRDPRAVAISILSQNWGPDNLESSVTWVKSYLDAWITKKKIYRKKNIPLICMQIEDICKNTAYFSKKSQDFIGVEDCGDLFADPDESSLYLWKKKTNKAQLNMLDQYFNAYSNLFR